MTDYYVLGTGHTAWGPYRLEDARACAAAFAHEHDGDRSATIVGTVETVYSQHYDDELPEEPPEDAPRPWEG
jgi:hypothetical protein